MLISPFGPFFMASRRGFAPFVAYGAAVTLNSGDQGPDIVLSGGDLIAESGASDTSYDCIRATTGKATGCWYWEAKLSQATNDIAFLDAGAGDSVASLTGLVGASSTSCGIISGEGAVRATGLTARSGAVPTFSVNDVLNFALDMGRGELYIGHNGSYLFSAIPQQRVNPTVTGFSGTFFPMIAIRGAGGGTVGGEKFTMNFGGSAFANSIPN
jgi:hypothetical protein